MRLITLAMIVYASVLVLGQQSETVYSPGNGVSLPAVVKEVKANYTQEAKDQRIEGTVELGCVVKSDGAVGDVTVVRSLDSVFGLDREAVKAMKHWTFKPGTKDGKRVDGELLIWNDLVK